jgi:hypothetical protein
MNPWKMIGPVVLVALTLVAAPADAQRRGGGRSPGGGGSRGPGVGGSRAVPRSVGSRSFGSRSFGSRVIVASPYRSFSRPYYTFRPRISVGFGLYAGYSVGYPYYGYGYGYPYLYRYDYGYPYPYPYASYPYPYAYSGSGYPYPDYRPSANATSTYQNYPQQAPPAQGGQGSIGVAPGTPQRSSGGISFDIAPSNAQVYIDGEYVGLVSNFSPTSQPLTLAPGRHHVEIRLVGYQTMTFETEVTSGQVVPYQGTMQR